MKQDEFNFILLNIGSAIHHADWNYKNVNSPFARIYLVTGGTAQIHLPDKIQILTPGHLYIIPPYTLHSYECSGFFTLYYIHVYEPPHKEERILEDYIYPTEVNAHVHDEDLIIRLKEINPERGLKAYDPSEYDNYSTLMTNIKKNQFLQPHKTFETQGILLQLFSRFLIPPLRYHEIKDDRIFRSLRYIRKNLDKEIDLQNLADASSLTKDHYIRLFKKEMKITPTQYINQKKIEKAQLMLLTDEKSVKDIAYSLGINNISYFCRLFKSVVGSSPSEYKKNTTF